MWEELNTSVLGTPARLQCKGRWQYESIKLLHTSISAAHGRELLCNRQRQYESMKLLRTPVSAIHKHELQCNRRRQDESVDCYMHPYRQGTSWAPVRTATATAAQECGLLCASKLALAEECVLLGLVCSWTQ